MSRPIVPTCPTDCASPIAYPEYSECAPETNVGEIIRLFVAPLDSDSGHDGGPCFEDVGDLPEWINRLYDEDDNPTGDVVASTVWGEMPEGEITEIPISGDRIARGRTQYVLNLEVDETNNTNYAFARVGSGCILRYLVWWETAGGKIYGGNCGVEATVMANFVTPKNRTELEKILVTVKWRDRFLPERTDSPFA